MSSDSTVFTNLASFYMGLTLANMLYGIEICLYVKTVHILLTRKRQQDLKSNSFHAAFSTMVFAMATVFVGIETSQGQSMWQQNRNYPGIPIAYGQRLVAYAPVDAAAVVALVLQQMAGALVMYHCLVMGDTFRVIIVPFIMWFIMFVFGIIAIFSAGTTTTNFFSAHVYEFGLTYYSVSVFLNATLTSMICYRLVQDARAMKVRFGTEHSYFSIARFLVEAMLPLTLVGIASVISYGIRSPSRVALSLVYTLMTGVSPQMLILRVVEGHAWQKDTRPVVSTLIFPSYVGNSSSSGDGDGDGSAIHVASLPGMVSELGKEVYPRIM